MKHVVVYDIEDDKVRLRMAHVLERYGRRVQESVFECDLTEPALDQMTKGLREALGSPDKGNVRVYQVCANCMRASFGLGDIAPSDDDPCIIID